jgi:hypothetical protein
VPCRAALEDQNDLREHFQQSFSPKWVYWACLMQMRQIRFNMGKFLTQF